MYTMYIVNCTVYIYTYNILELHLVKAKGSFKCTST